MKKLLLGAVCLALVFGSTASLEAAECGDVPVAPNRSTEPQETVSPELAELIEAGIISSTETRIKVFDFEICTWIACQLTPTGCSCSGFYCNGNFICGIRTKN